LNGILLVGTPPLSVLSWTLAAVPIIALLVLMVGRNWGGAKAGAVGWLSALLVAVLAYGASAELIAYSQTKAILLSFWVLYIIWAALFLFHVVNEAGAIKVIGDALVRVTEDKVIQLLLLAWIFTSFLQGVSGYGVPVAIVAPLMAGIGFSPIVSVVATSIGHTWSVTFGSLAASFFALVGVTGLDPATLASPLALMLGFTAFIAGGGAVWAYDGPRAVIRAAPFILLVGTIMAAVQWVMAWLGYYSLASFTAGLVGIAIGVAVVRAGFFGRRGPAPLDSPAGSLDIDSGSDSNRVPVGLGKFLLAVSAYLVLIAMVLAVNLITPLNDLLDRVAIDPSFPATETSYGWTNPAVESYRSLEVLSHAGAILFYAAIIGYFIYRRAGSYQPGAMRRILRHTLAAAVSASLGIVTLVGMALMMMESGMTHLLAQGTASVAGEMFPFLSPFVGVLGAFMTGSNTNSNILFGALQLDTARLLDLPVGLILAAQTTGGALGGIIAPAKIIVGCSTVGLSGREGPVIRAGVKYGVGITAIIGLVTLVLAYALS
jgi:lactate permease